MFRKIVKAFSALVIVVAAIVATVQQPASANTCTTLSVPNVTQANWQCVQNLAASKGFPISGNSGSESKFGCEVGYDYSSSSQVAKFELIRKSFFCPLSCQSFEKEANTIISQAKQDCGISGS